MTWQGWLLKLMVASLLGGALDMLAPPTSTRNYLRFLWGVMMLALLLEPVIGSIGH